jgi:hypothetical protein
MESDDLNPASLPPGTSIGPWRLLEQRGRGAYGVVYRADRVEEPPGVVALKLALYPAMPASYVRPSCSPASTIRRSRASSTTDSGSPATARPTPGSSWSGSRARPSMDSPSSWTSARGTTWALPR